MNKTTLIRTLQPEEETANDVQVDEEENRIDEERNKQKERKKINVLRISQNNAAQGMIPLLLTLPNPFLGLYYIIILANNILVII